MEMELDVLSEAHAGLLKAEAFQNVPVGGAGIYGPLAGAVQRLRDWLRGEAAVARPDRNGRCQTILHGPQVGLQSFW